MNILTVKSEQPNILLATMEQYGELYKLHTNWAIDNKSYSKQKAHEALYSKCRKGRNPLKSLGLHLSNVYNILTVDLLRSTSQSP